MCKFNTNQLFLLTEYRLKIDGIDDYATYNDTLYETFTVDNCNVIYTDDVTDSNSMRHDTDETERQFDFNDEILPLKIIINIWGICLNFSII